ncbi:MAG: hypothetical protein ABIH72_05450 [archaeon]
MKIIMFIVMFLIIGGLFIISENRLALRNPENFTKFGGLYFDWMGGVFNNGIEATGYVVKMDWLPDETGS